MKKYYDNTNLVLFYNEKNQSFQECTPEYHAVLDCSMFFYVYVYKEKGSLCLYPDLNELYSLKNKKQQEMPKIEIPYCFKTIIRFNRIFNEWENEKFFYCEKSCQWKRYNFCLCLHFNEMTKYSDLSDDLSYIDFLYEKANFLTLSNDGTHLPPIDIWYNKYTNTWENKYYKIPENKTPKNILIINESYWESSKRLVYTKTNNLPLSSYSCKNTKNTMPAIYNNIINYIPNIPSYQQPQYDKPHRNVSLDLD